MPQPDHISKLGVPEPATLDADLQEVWTKCVDKLGYVPNVLSAYSLRPQRLRNFMTIYNEIMLSPSGLSKLEREMVAVVVSSANRCYYCLVAHGAAVRQLSGDPELGEMLALRWEDVSLTNRRLVVHRALSAGVEGPTKSWQARFVPIAEDCGLIRPIGRWVVQEACRQARAWQDAGLPPIPVSVNVSAVEFRNTSFLKNIVDILNETSLDPRYLEIELTESVLMAHVGSTTSVLRALKALGVQLAIDDFGTGWSSLSYLSHFPIDALKVDKSFVQEITSESHAAPIVSAVISLGRSLNHRVIAEGVETPAQLAFLKAEDCSEGQGYYFSRPLVAEQFAQMLETGMPRGVQK